MHKDIDKAIASVVEAIIDLEYRQITSITIDIQASGEHPYRLTTPAEDLPLVSVARTKPLPEV